MSVRIDESQLPQVSAWVAERRENTWIAEQLGVGEATVRRFRRRHDIPVPETQVAVEATPSTSVLDRAQREVEGEQTTEDRLRDDVDHYKTELRRAESVIKKQREVARVEDRIVAAIRNASAQPYENPLRSVPKFKASDTRGQHFVALISDAHGGEVVDPSQALGIEYNWDICVRRIEYIRDTIIKYADLRPYQIEKLWLPVLGDMLSGDIHDELRITNQFTLPEQSIEMGRVLYQVGADLAEYFPEVEMIVMPGNHPRMYKKPSFKNKFAGWEYTMGMHTQGMAQAANIENLTVDVPRDLIKIVNVLDRRIAFMHGDGVKSASFAGIPFYGLRQQREAVQALMMQVGQERIDMFCIGHFHQYVYWGGECDIIINGAIKGGDEYSIGTRLSANDPEQVLLEFHPEHGLTSQNRINLGHIN